MSLATPSGQAFLLGEKTADTCHSLGEMSAAVGATNSSNSAKILEFFGEFSQGGLWQVSICASEMEWNGMMS